MKPTYGMWYWPAWLGVTVVTFLSAEIYALVTGHPENTLSAWVWRTLQIRTGETAGQWSATDFLTFGVWLVLVTWLTYHFFWHKFT